MDNNNVVVQSNKLIEAHYKQEYTIQEQRMVLWIISEIHKDDYLNKKNGYKTITISAAKYAELLGVTPNIIYKEAQKIGDALMQKVLKIKEEKGWLLVHWVSKIRYDDGVITIDIHPDLIPYLIDLKEKFTTFKLENILYMQSTHAIKLYQLLTQYKAIGERTLAIAELRSILGILELKTYNYYGAIKRRIIEISKREINEKTDIIFNYEPIKQGHKVTAIKFKITSKPTQEEQAKKKFETFVADLPEGNTVKAMFVRYGFNQAMVTAAFQDFIKNFINYEPTSSKPIESIIEGGN